MTQYAVHTKNNKTFAVEGINDTAVLLVVEGKIKPIKPSTFKRWYKLLDQQLKVDEQQTEEVIERQAESEQKHNEKRNWKDRYKSYKRNNTPLWDAVIVNNTLILRDTDKNEIIHCVMSKSGTCIAVKQVEVGCKRYFTNFSVVRKHILNNQDIRTIQSIGLVFDKWLADQKLVH